MESAFALSVASVVEDVLQQHEDRSCDIDFDARRAEEAAIRRYEAAAWLRKVVGVVGARDLPSEPSEEEFRLGLRSGIILCNALNKIQQGAVQKVVESPCDPSLIPDGAALTAFQYFENLRNFLVAVEDLGMPTFEASDLEQGGKCSRVVNSVLALKSYHEWKQAGGHGVWRFSGNVKPATSGKQFVRKNSEPFTRFLSRNTSANEKSLNDACTDKESSNMPSSSLSMLVRAVLSNKKPEEIPNLVESVLSKVVDEFEHRLAGQNQMRPGNFRDSNTSQGKKFMLKPTMPYGSIEQNNDIISNRDDELKKNTVYDQESESRSLKQRTIVDQQQNDIKVLKQTLSTTKAGMQFMQMKFQEEIGNLGLHIHGLAHAASGYHRVLEENRKLYNQVQDLKGSIRVYCRVRPFLPGQHNSLSSVGHIEEGTITINTSTRNGKGQKSFHFNQVFGPSATQEEVFSDTQPLIRSVLDGYNVCIFAYGQTGSGKTYTMAGPKDLTESTQGVNYRALGDLFLLAEQRRDTFVYDVSVQMIEIYNEQVRDLLVPDGSCKRLEIRNSSQTGLSVPDATLMPVSSTSDVIYLMNLGHKNRAVGATALNDRSSRSHSCLTVHVQGRDLTSGNILRGCMHLVDLAGSERVDKSEVTGDRLKEAQHINKSLSALGDVISSLAQKNSHVPYRNSKLTQLLQDSLGGQAKALMFVHISPEPDAIGETISTLKFAERVATVELGAARVNKESADVKELREQIASLKAALARKDPESVPTQNNNNNVYSSPQRSQPKNMGFLSSPNGLRKPMEDVGNIEVHKISGHRQKKPSFDLDELLGSNSPVWPPVSSPCLNNADNDEDREVVSGEWEDKLMVNKQDPIGMFPNRWGDPNNDRVPDHLFNQRYFENPCSLANAQPFDHVKANDDSDELDMGTSDSSEPDLLWHFNHSNLNTTPATISAKIDKPRPKQTKSPEIRSMSMIPKGPSPLQKTGHSSSQRAARQQTSNETKRKAGIRK
ncbi:kinesin-like protein KIN-14I [Andrographis paniculata]|uniref:kinesin-like protein KIN-14I n=1 Tax=Andrographis paniculata TaxID=175694 RepID=UPI0021E8F3E1|nr:kinesin-like protein KIN-14I [Andrographis paniculata]